MSDATTQFFEELEQRGHVPSLRKGRGTVRFDIAHGGRIESRYLTIDRGNVTVSKKRTVPDGVIRVDRPLFDRLATGELNPVAAVLRGEFVIEGDPRLLLLVQRLLPAAPGARGPRRRAGWAKRRR